jgi:hypothetical protein
MHEETVEEAQVQQFLSQIIEASGLELLFDLYWTKWPMPILTIRFHGADVSMLTANDRELLEAFRHLILAACGFHSVDAPALAMMVLDQEHPVAPVYAG